MTIKNIKYLFINKGNKKQNLKWMKIGGVFHKNIMAFVYPKTEEGRLAAGGFETFLYQELELIKKGKHVIYDIGAHLGYHTLGFLSLLSNNSIVYAFEPDPQNYKRLIKNIKYNSNLKDNIKVFDIAISDINDEVVFNIYNNIEDGASSESHINFTSNKPENISSLSKEIMVRSMRLDDVIKSSGFELPTIIKMDIEGAESRALHGAKQSILVSKPIIFVEIHDMLNMYKTLTFFNEIDYKYKLIHVEKDGRCFIKAYYQ